MTSTEKRLSIEEIEKAYPEAYRWAREFHDLYEETAPMFGYETKKETKEFDTKSPNGRLMAYVCFNSIQQAIAEERERVRRDISALDGHYTNVTNEKDVYERGFAVGYDTGWNDVLLKLRTALLSPQQSNPNKNI